MSIISRNMFAVKCDVCGAEAEDAWTDRVGAEDTALGSEWHRTTTPYGVRHVCPDCYAKQVAAEAEAEGRIEDEGVVGDRCVFVTVELVNLGDAGLFCERCRCRGFKVSFRGTLAGRHDGSGFLVPAGKRLCTRCALEIV